MKRMKSLLAASCLILALCSCSKDIVSDSENQLERTAQLGVTTRADGDQSGINDGRIYVFNQAGTCIEVLTTEEGTQQATTMLAPGTYQVYAVGSEDLSRYSLPSKADAKTDSEITLNEGSAMEDFLTAHAQITLTDGVDQQLDLHMVRKVAGFNSFSIKKVPTDVTAVSVTMEPLYKRIKLDGSFPDATEAVTITLTNKGGGLWQAAPQMLHFPSKGNPTISIAFTNGEGVKSYSYTANEALEANHHYAIEGTYTQSQGVSLTGIIYNSAWGEDKTITFDFNDDNISNNNDNDDDGNDSGNSDVTMPTPGSTYKGCYVVAVNGTTATLLSNNQEHGYNLSNDNSTAINSLNTSLASWPSEDEITGTWRIPTLTEAQVFLADPNSFDIAVGSGIITYFVLDESELKGITVKQTATKREFGSLRLLNEIGPESWLRPVIDVTVE